MKPTLTEEHKEKVQDRLKLMTGKGVYPYEYFDSWERFNEDKLPSKEQFYSHLKDKHIKDEDYHHAQEVFSKMNMSTLKNYHDFYLATDILLLADVFETFRDTCIQHYDLDPAHFYTAPGYHGRLL